VTRVSASNRVSAFYPFRLRAHLPPTPPRNQLAPLPRTT
jgi:hypothetical protein